MPDHEMLPDSKQVMGDECKSICWMCCDLADGKDRTVLTLFSTHVMDDRPFHLGCWKRYCGDITRIKGPDAMEELTRYVEEKESDYKKAMEE